MSAQVFTFSAEFRPSHGSRGVSASVVVLADRRTARTEVRVTCDPIALGRSWWDFWAGAKR